MAKEGKYGKGAPGGTVRISMSAKVANDLDAFKKGIVRFAEELGCPECFSGLDCTFESEREFTLGPGPELQRFAVSDGPVSRGAGARQVTVPLSLGDEFDLKSILKKIDILGKRIGPHWEQGGQALCCSGFDVTFGRETELLGGGRDF